MNDFLCYCPYMLEKHLDKSSELKLITEFRDVQDLRTEERCKIVDIYKYAYVKEDIAEKDCFNKESKTLILRENGRICASATLIKSRILWLGVSKDFRGKELGVTLLSTVIENEPKCWIAVGASFPHVIRTAIKAGFRTISDLDKFYLVLDSSGTNTSNNVPSQLIFDTDDQDTAYSLCFSRTPGKKSFVGHDNNYIQIIMVSPLFFDLN